MSYIKKIFLIFCLINISNNIYAEERFVIEDIVIEGSIKTSNNKKLIIVVHCKSHLQPDHLEHALRATQTVVENGADGVFFCRWKPDVTNTILPREELCFSLPRRERYCTTLRRAKE